MGRYQFEPAQPFTWSEHGPEYPGLHNLKDANGVLIAWIDARPAYCDRGNWKGMVESVPDLDSQDGWPNYYMSLERAKVEVHDFLMWRLFKVRCED